MGYVHAKLVVATCFYKLWNTMLAHNCHIPSQIVTHCHDGLELKVSLACISATVVSPGKWTSVCAKFKYSIYFNIAQSYIQQWGGGLQQYIHVSY